MDTCQKRTQRLLVPLRPSENDRLKVASEISGLPRAQLMRSAALKLADQIVAGTA